MNRRSDNGGPAFPFRCLDDSGMTLRDYFAAKALAGMCAAGQQTYRGDDLIATDAYSLADAMLKAREAP